jgi:lipid II:glycine glycyltransferase (peptidoglycan interpeptide bridge formation enzyme)
VSDRSPAGPVTAALRDHEGSSAPTDVGHVGRDRLWIDDASDGEWDAFLLEVGASYLQSSRWARVKGPHWTASRIVVRRGDDIVGGAQVLHAPMTVFGAAGGIGVCAMGPVLPGHDPRVGEVLLAHLARLCRHRRIRSLIIQPPSLDEHLERGLRLMGCSPSPVAVAPGATVLVDLAPVLSEIEQRLSKQHRKSLRRARDRGVLVERGGRDDVELFHRLLTSASKRLGYRIFPVEHYQRMWDLFAPQGDAVLLVASHRGEAISAQLCIAFGDTVTAKALGWSGQRTNLAVNDLLDWEVITWAKERGSRFLDLENLSRSTAIAVASGVDPNDLTLNGADAYKLKWSRDVVVFPEPKLYIPNRFVRAVARRIPPDQLRRRVKQRRPGLRALRARPGARAGDRSGLPVIGGGR